MLRTLESNYKEKQIQEDSEELEYLRDFVTGARRRKINLLNKKSLSSYELDEYMNVV